APARSEGQYRQQEAGAWDHQVLCAHELPKKLRPKVTTPMRFATPAACLLLVAIPTIARPEPLAAQQQDGSVLHWWHGAVAIGGLSALMLLDGPVQRFEQDNRGTGSNNVARLVRHFGQPE